MWAFSSCGEQWLLSSYCVQQLLSSCGVRASHCSDFFCEEWALNAWASIVSEHGLSSCDSVACEIFLNQ